MRTKVATGHVPRRQQSQLHAAPGRFKVLVTHRRFGKTVFAVNELISGAKSCKLRQPRFAYLAPYHIQAKDVAWSYLKLYTAKIPDIAVNETELWVELPPRIEHGAGIGGARIRLYGADNADRLRGLYFDGVVLDEYAQMHPRVWSEVVRPALADRMGWALFIGTPMGRNGFCDLFEGARDGFPLADGTRQHDPDWASFMFKASETGIIAPPELEAAQRAMSPDQYAQEFECSFDAAIPGAYYAQLLAEAERLGRVRPIAYEPALPVHTGWDLGIGDPLPADTLEGGFDRAVMRDQQLKDSQDRALTFPVTIAPGVSAVLPNPQADAVLGWNSAADGLENKALEPGTTVYSSISNTNAGTATNEAVTPAGLAGSKFNPAGKHHLPLTGSSFVPDTTTAGGGPSVASTVTTTNKLPFRTLDFDGATQENAGIMIAWPKSADEGTITFRFRWLSTGGTAAQGVVMGLAAIGFGDGDVVDTATGTVVKVTDTLLAVGQQQISPESAAITIKNLAEGDTVHLLLTRFTADAGDTMSGADCKVIGVDVFLTTNTGTDA